MNYYQNTRNGYFMDNNEEHYNDYNDYYNNDKYYCDNDFDKKRYGHDKNRCCRVRKVEETYLCFPSYYTEDKKEDVKEKCFEGTFKIWPKYNNYLNEGKCDNKYNYHKCCQNTHNKCGFCNLFHRW